MKQAASDPNRTAASAAKAGSRARAGDSLSMHANVPVWCDCCTCEAEPYWVEAMAGDEPGARPADHQPLKNEPSAKSQSR